MKLSKSKPRQLHVGFCERCRSVCVSRCRAESTREQVRNRAFETRFGV